ncbi:putative two-component system hybrid sensor and regulator [Novosphingobium sp. Rr 2-17]|uniref:hybrid sensor histidine kinase/response regulator n=1 Tax=Novosphingobium sp. Rr 2-17 TaxID=555793 RepID=UPI00026984AE|nr:hybrid sensor histidine kinase/response regulator [Novosphingobium sp. Rr 2-17]EIZ81277.1 putative two-component system hybrid sensor and regulator [Novosphingobium sp. Rr 2-17]
MSEAGAERLRAILAAAGTSGSWDWDIAEDLLRVDPRFAELYGLDPDAAHQDLPTASFFTAIHPADRARIRIAVAGMLAGAERFSKEFRVVAPDGSTLWMHGRGQAHLDENDEPVRFTGLLIDITERKRTEERLRIAQSAGGVGTFEYIDGFATATVSTEFCQLLGLHPAAVLPVRTINSVLRDGEPLLLPQPGSDAIADTLEAVFRIVRNDDGRHRWIARRGEVLREGSGYRLIGVIYDVTAAKEQEAKLRELADTLEMRVQQEVAERREAEEALRQAQKMEAVGQLTGGIAHDFNNLLTVIIGNIDTVIRRMDMSHDPRMRRSLDNALKGAERAASLTQRLLAFSRRQPLEPKTIDIARVLTGMSDLLTRSITESIAIQIATDADLWKVEVDPHQLENAILNLAVNARDAMPSGGVLTIEARNVEVRDVLPGGCLPGSYVVVSVIDSGTGMSAETVAKVFDPFFTTKEVGKGTGLGLSMVYGFVKQSGGHVTVESAEGRGTVVRLYLARKLQEVLLEIEELRPSARMGNADETILVVEDDDDVRAYTVGILRELGYDVIEAQDGDGALQLLGGHGIRVKMLLTDVVMPRMSGPELASRAKALHPDLRVLFTSGYTRDAIMRDDRLDPNVDLLSKPFTYATLAAKVRELLDRGC